MTQAKKTFLVFLVLFTLSALLIYKGIEPGIFRDIQIKIPAQPQITSESQPQVLPAQSVNSPEASGSSNVIDQLYPVRRVVDGDTIEIESEGQVKAVRLIGINTPETVDPRRPVQCFGVEASNETKKLLTGTSVRMEKDVSETDRYGRLLRFIYLTLSDGSVLFVNDYLVREGFAHASTFPPDVAMSNQFKLAETQARENKKGLWGSCQN